MVADVELLLRVISLTKKINHYATLSNSDKEWGVEIKLKVDCKGPKEIKETLIEDAGGLEAVIDTFDKHIEELEKTLNDNEKDKIS